MGLPTKVMSHRKATKQLTNLAVVQELFAHTGGHHFQKHDAVWALYKEKPRLCLRFASHPFHERSILPMLSSDQVVADGSDTEPLAVPCCAMLCHAVSCCAALCWAGLCHAALC